MTKIIHVITDEIENSDTTPIKNVSNVSDQEQEEQDKDQNLDWEKRW